MSSCKILYIHGFNSSPGSAKAAMFSTYFNQHFPDIQVHVPQLKTSPNLAIAQLEDIIASDAAANWFFVGSSLGGYFSTYLANKYQRPAALVNPAVKPYELLSDYIGPQCNPYTLEEYEVTQAHMTELKLLEVKTITNPSLYYLLVQMGDEVLPAQDAIYKYQHCQQLIQQGGDHSFVNFEAVVPDIVKFFQIA